MGFIMSCLYFLFILLPWILLPPAGSPTPVALCSLSWYMNSIVGIPSTTTTMVLYLEQ